MHFLFKKPQKNLHHVKIKSKISNLGKKISFLPKKISEQKAVEVDAKNRQKSKKVHFLKCTFWPQKYFGPPKFLAHAEIKSKPSYLGETISILPKKMTEQLAIEVDVKNALFWSKCTLQLNFV